MFKNSRKTIRSSSVVSLNTPKQLEVIEGSDCSPVKIFIGSIAHSVSVRDVWRIDEEWWRDRPISRMYWECISDNGGMVTIFKDLLTNLWYRQSA